MDPDRLRLYHELAEEVASEAEMLLSRYRAIFTEAFGANDGRIFDDSCKFVSFSSLDEDRIFYSGDENWSYGGHEHYDFKLPTFYLSDPDWEAKVRAEFERDILSRDKRLSVAKQADEAKQRKLLEELKAKFE